MAAGQAANPVARRSVAAPSAIGVVPGYTTAPPESAYYRQPNLATQGNARLALCATLPNDPICQAQRGALSSANTPRPVISPDDPSVDAARQIARSPSATLGNLAAYYSGCTLAVTGQPATTQTRQCQRYLGVGNFTCTRSLTVHTTRTTSCSPGDWFAHAEAGNAGIDVQCRPDQPESSQHFRITRDGAPLTFFDMNMSAQVLLPEVKAVLGTSISWMTGFQTRGVVWAVDSGCSGDDCTLTTMIGDETREFCSGGGETGYNCSYVEPFEIVRAGCRPGTQSGNNIQNTVCQGEDSCSTTMLDGNKCYAPANEQTPYVGSDITGTLPGFYWTFDADRAVIGWAPNPAYGPMTTMLLAYSRPTATVSELDHWDDQCPALAGGGRCTVRSAPVCYDGPASREIDGATVSRDCWTYTSTMTCGDDAADDSCALLAAAGCAPLASACKQSNLDTGLCEIYQDSYSCPVPAQDISTASNCQSNVFCLEGNCFDISAPNDADFARSMSMLEAGREAGVYLDADRMQVFKGEDNRCRDRLLKNCCYADGAGAGMSNQGLFGSGSRLVYDVLMNAENRDFLYHGMSALLTGAGFSGSFTSYGVTVAVNGTALPAGSSVLFAGDSVVVAFDPWSLAIAVVVYIVLDMVSCSADEGKLAMKEGARLCHAVGSWCSSCIRVLGFCVSCIEHTTSKCCFNSLLARIVNEQGRMQIAKTWGGAQSPDCSGFTVAQLQALDFAAMDLSEFYASLVPTLPNLATLQGNSERRIPTCYYGQGRCR